MVKNRKGWIEVVEAFLSVVVLIALLVIIISKGSVEGDFDSEIYQKEIILLQSIEVNDTLRNEILNISDGNLPLSLEDLHFPPLLEYKIKSSKLFYLNCSAKICKVDDSCLIDDDLEADIYSRSIGIFANNSEYNPRQLKFFCWEKEILNESFYWSDDSGEGFAYYNSSGDKVASFKNNGDIVLAGDCLPSASCYGAPADSFKIFSGLSVVSYIDNQGDLCIVSGDCSSSQNCDSPIGDAFTIRNSDGDIVIYIDSTGDLCLKGTLYTNENP